MAEVVQTVIRREQDRFLADCFDYPFQAEADSIEQALAEIERQAREYFAAVERPDRPASDEIVLLAVSLYFGPVQWE